MIPFKLAGYGNRSQARWVMKVTFSEPCSGPAKLTAYRSETFPKVGMSEDIAGQIFKGTELNGYQPFLSIVDTTLSTPNYEWKLDTAVVGNHNPNRVCGTNSYVTTVVTPGPLNDIYFNLCLEIPADAGYGEVDADLAITYEYTGSLPMIRWYGNENTEANPTWTEITSGVNGLRFCDIDTESEGPYLLTIPEFDAEDAKECWVTR
jgi:hypothetical protein